MSDDLIRYNQTGYDRGMQPASEGDWVRYTDAADTIAALRADKAFIIAERDKTFALMLSRAEKAEAEVAALRAHIAATCRMCHGTGIRGGSGGTNPPRTETWPCDHGISALTAPADPQPEASFQERVHPWMLACFGAEIAADKIERNHRFLEEALELVQATGCTKSEAHQLVDYVYGRETGDPVQEVGGVMVTLAALCLANGFDMHIAGETELARIWTKIEKIRAKQAAKPKHSPLPQHVDPQPVDIHAALARLREKGIAPTMTSDEIMTLTRDRGDEKAVDAAYNQGVRDAERAASEYHMGNAAANDGHVAADMREDAENVEACILALLRPEGGE